MDESMDVKENTALRNLTGVFESREDGARALVELLDELDGDTLVLGIPSGGVPVAREVSRALALDMDIVVVRKVQVPFNPEAGLGAVGPEGIIRYNEGLMGRLGLDEAEVQRQTLKARESVRLREELFRGDREYPDMHGRSVLILDDGLASGFTMLAAMDFVGQRKVSSIMVGAPTGSSGAVRMLADRAETVYCPNIREGMAFAVAEAYRHWHDLSDAEVIRAMGDAFSD